MIIVDFISPILTCIYLYECGKQQVDIGELSSFCENLSKERYKIKEFEYQELTEAVSAEIFKRPEVRIFQWVEWFN